eukprot:763513-Hanusia_phi.AAC.2
MGHVAEKRLLLPRQHNLQGLAIQGPPPLLSPALTRSRRSTRGGQSSTTSMAAWTATPARRASSGLRWEEGSPSTSTSSASATSARRSPSRSASTSSPASSSRRPLAPGTDPPESSNRPLLDLARPCTLALPHAAFPASSSLTPALLQLRSPCCGSAPS